MASMRQVAREAGVQASTMHRLATQLGFDGYEAFRNVYRQWLARGDTSFSARATQLQRHRGKATSPLIQDILQADLDNLGQLLDETTAGALTQAHDALRTAGQIYVVGLRSLFPAAYYFSYSCGMFLNNTVLLAGTGGGFADSLRRARAGDALIVFSCQPYAKDALAATRYAHRKGARIIAVTDSAVSPVAKLANVTISFSNQTPSLFPSVVPALAVAQTLVAMLVASGGKTSLNEIARSEAQLAEFDTYVGRGARGGPPQGQ